MSSQPAAAAPERTVVMIVASHPILRNAIYESLLLMQPDWEHVEAPGLQIVVLTDSDGPLWSAAYESAGASACVRKRKLFAELQPLLPELVRDRPAP